MGFDRCSVTDHSSAVLDEGSLSSEHSRSELSTCHDDMSDGLTANQSNSKGVHFISHQFTSAIAAPLHGGNQADMQVIRPHVFRDDLPSGEYELALSDGIQSAHAPINSALGLDPTGDVPVQSAVVSVQV